jgi:hypothetical protein
MGNLLEKFGLRKNQEQASKQEAMRGMEKYLQDSIDQYRMNRYRLQSMPETFLGLGHQEDTKDIDAVQYSLENLRKIILAIAHKLGKDGNALIAKIDEEVQKKRVA